MAAADNGFLFMPFFFDERFPFDRVPEADFSFAISALSFFSFFFRILIVFSFLDIFVLAVIVVLCANCSTNQPPLSGLSEMLVENGR